MTPQPAGQPGTAVKIAYVLGTTAGGTGTHVAMLARGCAERGMPVRVFGPAQAGRQFFPAATSPPSRAAQGPAAGGQAAGRPAASQEAASPAAGGQAGGRPAASQAAGGPAADNLAAASGGPEGSAAEGAEAEGAEAEGSEAEGSPAFVVVDVADRPRPVHDMAAVLLLRRLLRDWAPDIVHAHGLRAGTLTAMALTGQAPAAQALTAQVPAAQALTGQVPAAQAPAAGPAARARARTYVRSMILKTSHVIRLKSLQDQEKGAREPAPRRGEKAAGRPKRPALVVTVHNAPAAGGVTGLIYAALERIAARRADAVTWVSADLGARMRRAGAPDGGRALVPAPQIAPPSAGQVAAARASLGGQHRPVVLAAGRLVAQKGFSVLLAAAARWQDRDPVPLLVIAGDGPLAGPLASQARGAGAETRFLGQRGDIPALLGAADVVVVPSQWEGQPLIVQEALRAGRPLVASRTGGIPDLTGEDAALLVPPGDPVALATAVTSVLDDPGLAAKLAAAATRRATELPDVSDAVDSVIRLYRRLLR